MNKKIFVVLLLCLSLIITGCTATAQTEVYEARIAELEAEITLLKVKVDILEDMPYPPTLSINGGGYSLYENSYGHFSISIEGAEEYLDGYKIQLQVGNLTTAKLASPTFKVSWGKELIEAMSIDQLVDTNNTKEFSTTTDLRSGSWNSYEIFIPGVSLDEIQYLKISFEAQSMSLTE